MHNTIIFIWHEHEPESPPGNACMLNCLTSGLQNVTRTCTDDDDGDDDEKEGAIHIIQLLLINVFPPSLNNKSTSSHALMKQVKSLSSDG